MKELEAARLACWAEAKALRKVTTSDGAPTLARTTALAALWERGAREVVERPGSDSDGPAVRCKVRALKRARP